LLNMRDVARLAGVSTGTVSAVINDKGGVSIRLVKKVKAAMEALDYRPNQVARSLKVQQTHTIGMVVPDVSNPFFTDVMHGVEDEARRNGYSVILCNANEDPELERSQLEMLFSRRVDGVLLAPTSSRVGEERLTQRRFPLVLFDRIPPGFAGAAVVTDSLSAAHAAAHHLISLGHVRIAIIAGRLDLTNGLDRLEGFRKALQEAHLPLREEYLRKGNFQLESGYRCGLELMQLPQPPTAVFCCNNKMTLGLMRALGELRIPCPERVSVLGFDDFEWAANFSPRLTTIAQPTKEMGKQATAMLVGKMHREKGIENHGGDHVVVLSNELRIRDSTGPPFQGRPAREGKEMPLTHSV